VHASFEVDSTFCRTHIDVHGYQTTEKQLNVSVTCDLCEQPLDHIVGLLSPIRVLFLAKEKKPSKIIIDSFFIVLFV
jgi:hypothetical protein